MLYGNPLDILCITFATGIIFLFIGGSLIAGAKTSYSKQDKESRYTSGTFSLILGGSIILAGIMFAGLVYSDFVDEQYRGIKGLSLLLFVLATASLISSLTHLGSRETYAHEASAYVKAGFVIFFIFLAAAIILFTYG